MPHYKTLLSVPEFITDSAHLSSLLGRYTRSKRIPNSLCEMYSNPQGYYGVYTECLIYSRGTNTLVFNNKYLNTTRETYLYQVINIRPITRNMSCDAITILFPILDKAADIFSTYRRQLGFPIIRELQSSELYELAILGLKSYTISDNSIMVYF